MVEMTMGQQQEGYAFQRDPIAPQVFDQFFGFEAATGIDEREIATAVNGINIAIVVVRDRATQKAASDEVNAGGDPQSSRSFE